MIVPRLFHPPRTESAVCPSLMSEAAYQPFSDVQRTFHRKGSFIHHVGVDHGRTDVLMPEQLLHGADIVSVFEQTGGKAVPEGVAADMLVDAGYSDRFLHGPLQGGRTDMVPHGFSGYRVS